MTPYLLFDLDGTLTDSSEGITKCVQYALSKYGISAECSDLLCFIGPPLHDSFEKYYGMEPQQAKQAVDYYRERYQNTGLFENQLYDGIPETLEALRKKGIHLAVATSKPTGFTLRICEHFGLTDYFEAIIGSELDGTRERKVDVIREVLRVLNCAPENATMVGDRNYDIIGAHECGLSAIGVRWGFADPGEFEKAGADRIIDHPSELLKL